MPPSENFVRQTRRPRIDVVVRAHLFDDAQHIVLAERPRARGAVAERRGENRSLIGKRREMPRGERQGGVVVGRFTDHRAERVLGQSVQTVERQHQRKPPPAGAIRLRDEEHVRLEVTVEARAIGAMNDARLGAIGILAA